MQVVVTLLERSDVTAPPTGRDNTLNVVTYPSSSTV
jgi:hypothetical protein